MTGLKFRHISFVYTKFGSVIYQTCAGWIRYPVVYKFGTGLCLIIEEF